MTEKTTVNKPQSDHRKPTTAPEQTEGLENDFALDMLRGPERNLSGMSADTVRYLSRTMGNHALQRLIQRDPEDTATMEGEQEAIGEQALPADLQEFLSRGVMPSEDGKDMVGAGGIGGFNAKFDPDNREVVITVRIGVAFLSGLRVNSSGVIEAEVGDLTDGTDPANQNIFETGTRARLVNEATRLNSEIPDPVSRRIEVNTNWRWAPGEADPWMAQYRQNAQTAWSDKHFFISKKWHNQLMSNVRVVMDIHSGHNDDDHCKAKIVKTPTGDSVSAGVTSGSATDAGDQTLTMSSADLVAGDNSLLQQEIYFENNSSDVGSAKGGVPTDSTDAASAPSGLAHIRRFVTTYKAANPANTVPIRIVGHASSVGSAAYNQTLSEQRAAAVEAALHAEMTAQGVAAEISRTSDSGEGETGATANAGESRRVDLIVGSGEAQNTGNHEFGHLLGLGDEYATPAGGFIGNPLAPVNPGTPAAHSGMADAMDDASDGVDEVGPVGRENTDSIMSLGNTVRPQHYATFHHALQEVTGEEWQYGGAGDAPTVIPGTHVPGGVIT